jgi:hypothetical protein
LTSLHAYRLQSRGSMLRPIVKPPHTAKLTFAIMLLLTGACGAVGCQGSSPSPGATPASPTPPASELVAFEQEVLYDRRGSEMNDILLYRAIVLMNPGEGAVEATIRRELSPQGAENVDLESYFPIMADILPPGVTLPPVEQMSTLPTPTQEQTTSGGIALRWPGVTIGPGEAVVAYCSGHFQDAAALIDGDTAVLPLVRVQARGGMEGDDLRLEYKIGNSGGLPLEDVGLLVFLPIKVETQPAEDLVPLYDVVDLEFAPTPDQLIEETVTMDGNLAMAEGDLIEFGVPRLEPGEERTVEIRAAVQPTGASGDVVPYLSLTYHSVAEASESFDVQISSPAGTGIAFMPTLHIGNVAWPDVVRISF